jgi:predicted metal-dependent phosphoesterase TrpH
MEPRRFADLHVHSTASDGRLGPVELIRLADASQLAVVAITDHDTVAALPAAAKAAGQFPLLRFVPGIEISARFAGGTLHILGLGIDPTSPAIRTLCDSLQQARNSRNPKIIQKLGELGMNITLQDVLAEIKPTAGLAESSSQGQVVGRLHIAGALVRKGYVKTTAQAFEKYIGFKGPAFIDKETLEPRQAIEAIHAAAGLAMLAHPPLLGYTNFAQLERIVQDLVHAGLDGIECYHSESSAIQTRQCLNLARRHHLAISGGSDFHGLYKPGVQLGHPRVPMSVISEWLV